MQARDFFPCHAAAVGGVPNFLDYYFNVETKLRLQQKLQSSLPEALILPGAFPDLGVVVEASAFGGQVLWFKNGAPFIGPTLREPADVDHLRVPPAGLAGLMPLALTQREMMRRTLLASGHEMEQFAFSMGPAEIAALLVGYDKYYLMLYDDPNRTKRLMEIATDTVLGWLAKQAQRYGGVTVLVIGEHVFHSWPKTHSLDRHGHDARDDARKPAGDGPGHDHGLREPSCIPANVQGRKRAWPRIAPSSLPLPVTLHSHNPDIGIAGCSPLTLNISPPSSQRAQREPGSEHPASDQGRKSSGLLRRGESGTPRISGSIFACFACSAVKLHFSG